MRALVLTGRVGDGWRERFCNVLCARMNWLELSRQWLESCNGRIALSVDAVEENRTTVRLLCLRAHCMHARAENDSLARMWLSARELASATVHACFVPHHYAHCVAQRTVRVRLSTTS